ncbi:BINDING PROTEIN putative-RELATED [Salix koriyanagi]|uniref:BINDING PROTEIN putative-RELATED n=1 Tax=Salix koriyanagi TaxID=2511006 RepID=A0A9Q1A3G7_9ROSI|nr:BINDING PROTEIN putative-RELATED [Salix koriyanagi]
MTMKLFDAHCHLQDPRILNKTPQLIATALDTGVVRFAVNGVSEKDWNLVKEMGESYQSVIPCFGLHPWFIEERTPNWFNTLKEFFQITPSAAVGEVGLDKGSHGKKIDFNDQVEVFQRQLELAKELNRPVSVHCVRAFGDLLEIMKSTGPFPAGVILHSFLGSAEMVPEFANLGAYFSFSGFLMSMKKEKAKKMLKAVSSDRILLETDAPDALPNLHDGDSHPSALPRETPNHPANIHSVLSYVASLLDISKQELAELSYANAVRLFSYEGSKLSKSPSPSELELHVHGMPFSVDKGLLSARSAKIAALLEENPPEKLAFLLRDIPADPETFELVARFCHGYELILSTENVIPLISLAYYLEMTESHSDNNLLDKTVAFFEDRVLPSWNETIKALRSASSAIQQAMHSGLVEACFESLVYKALADPRLLGEPIKVSTCSEDSEDEEACKPNARRKLLSPDWKSEDLTTLSLQLYDPLIHAMNQHGVQPEYVAASLCQYVRKWANSGENESIYKRGVIEAVERLLPPEKGILPCKLLFEMLRFAICVECSNDCRSGFEIRIGKQLDQAEVKDLLIPSQGYSKEIQYDIECVRRILKHFYSNYCSTDVSGIISVAELIEEFLMEVASDIDLRIDTFVSLAEMSMAASLGTQRNSDGIYRAIDIYLDKHRYLTEVEREEVCRVLDCQKMSPEACEHAAKNERFPVRFVVQVLLVAQMQLRDTVTKEVQVFDDKLRREAVEDEEKKGLDEEEVRAEMERMSIKVMELERECCMMREEIEHTCTHQKSKRGKASMWRKMKRKLGCASSTHDCNCQAKRKKKF